MPLGNWFTFGPLSTWANADLDGMFFQLASMSNVPVTVAGSNTLALTTTIAGFSLTSYANYMMFCGVATAANTGSVVAAYGSLQQLQVYKDGPSGPVVLQGGEYAIGDMLYFTYDAALNSGNGGFHITISNSNSRISSSASIGFGSVLGGNVSNAIVSLSGVSIGDIVIPSIFTPASVGIVFQAFCAVNNTITLQACNYTGASITPPSGLYRFLVERSRP